MATSMYNNPMVGQSLSNMVSTFMGNPADTARAELAASEALNNNLTAQYRQALHGSGTGGNLSQMMIDALAAGPDYSRHAASAGGNALKFGAAGYGSGPYSQGPASAGLASMMSTALRGSGGGRRGGSKGGSSTGGGGSDGGYAWGELSVTGQAEAAKRARRILESGNLPEGVTENMLLAEIARNNSGWKNLAEATLDLENPEYWTQPTETVEKNGWFKDYTEEVPTGSPVFNRGGGTPAAVENIGGGEPTDNIVTVTSMEEAMALPSGSKFKTPDGQIKVRP